MDPYAHTVEIYHLQGEHYALHASLPASETLTPPQRSGFELPLTDLFAPE